MSFGRQLERNLERPRTAFPNREGELKLSEVVPWGRTFEEYRSMFDLTARDLQLAILGCGDGPASFNSEMTRLGHHVISVDPLYAFSRQEIKQRIQETYEPIISQTKQNLSQYRWTHFGNPDRLGQARLAAMEQFLQDFEAGLAERRYLPQALPTLSFDAGTFQLSLCSHFLFLYSAHLSLEFHLASIQELLRVSSELRIFPLLDLECRPSPYVDPVQAYFTARGLSVEIKTVPYEFQKGGNQMLRLAK